MGEQKLLDLMTEHGVDEETQRHHLRVHRAVQAMGQFASEFMVENPDIHPTELFAGMMNYLQFQIASTVNGDPDSVMLKAEAVAKAFDFSCRQLSDTYSDSRVPLLATMMSVCQAMHNWYSLTPGKLDKEKLYGMFQ